MCEYDPEMRLSVTLLYGGLCALLVTALGVWVSILRLRTGTYLGKELPRELVRPIRAHGNAAEWVPLGLVLLALLEASGVSSVALHVLGGTLLTERVLHAVGVLGKNRASMVAAALNYLVMSAMGVWAVALHFGC